MSRAPRKKFSSPAQVQVSVLRWLVSSQRKGMIWLFAPAD